MPNEIKVMICDDSVVMRRILKTVLSQDSEIDVVYAAQHGRDAVDNLMRVQPDVVVLDVVMPEMDGIEAVTEIRKLNKLVPIIMFSSVTTRGAEATFEALSAGANDFSPKPKVTGHLDQQIVTILDELVSKIKQYAGARVPSHATPVSTPPTQTQARSNVPAEVVAIGSSTGGPKALDVVLRKLDVQVPVLIVQHMPPKFTDMLAERLSAVSKMPVREAVDNAVAAPGEVWIAPGDFHMEVEHTGMELKIKLNQNARENSVRPAVDPLFRSVAKAYGKRALGIVLTGMGCDGLEGCRVMRNAGGQIITQDEATSAVWGMPGEVTQAGLSDRVLPIDQVAFEISRRTKPALAPST